MSNLVNETRLDYYTRQFWEKIKRDLTNGTFVNAQILPNGTTLQFTKKDGTTHDVDLSNFLRRNELTQNGGTNQQANMIPQLGADGKIDISMLPNIPFNNLHVVGTKNEIENMINIGTATAGDMFFVQDTNKVFIFANNQAPVFDDKIIEVGDKEGYVKTVNTIKPSPDGDVTVKSEHIEYVDNKQLNANTVQEAIDNLVDKVPTDVVSNVEYDGNKTLTVTKNNAPTQIDLSPLVGIKTIDQVAGDPDGNIEVGLRKDVDDLYLTVGGQDKAQIQLDYLKDTDLTKIGGQGQADKIPQLGADGKLHGTMMPDIAITSVTNVANEQEALDKIRDGSIQVGDVVVVAPNNEIYMHNGTPAGAVFGDSFIQLSLGDGTVKEVNGQRPAANGQVVVTSSDISYDKNISGLQSNNVKDAIDELNGKFVSNVSFAEATRTLKQTKNNQESDVVTGLVRVWKDLDYVEQYPYINLFDIAKGQQGKQYGTNGQIVNSTQNWYIVEIDVEEDTEYTLMKMHNYTNGYKVVFFNSDGAYHSEDNNNAPASNGWHRKTVRTPQGVTKVGLQFQYGIPQLPRAKETMFLRGNVTENINPFIPFADGNLIQVLKDISLEFDNSNSNIKSTTVESAIKEVNSRFTTTVKSVNDQLPNELGNVTVNASQINTLNGGSVENELSELSIRKADKYGNSFISDLTVEDIKITGNPIATIRSNVTTGSAGTKTLAGDKNTFVQVGTKVSKILVGVNGYTEGETVTGVEVYAVKRNDNTIFERIVYEGTGVARIPKGETDGVLYVDVEVNKSFTEEVYFIARLKLNGNKGMRLGGTHTSGIAFDKTSDDQELQQGSVIPIGTSTTKIPNMLIYGDGETLSNAIVNATLNNTNGIDFTKANGTIITVNIPNSGGGTVTSVNGVQPQGGEVTLTATVTQNVGQDIVLRVGNQNTFATLSCMTDQDANTIIAGFTL